MADILTFPTCDVCTLPTPHPSEAHTDPRVAEATAARLTRVGRKVEALPFLSAARLLRAKRVRECMS